MKYNIILLCYNYYQNYIFYNFVELLFLYYTISNIVYDFFLVTLCKSHPEKDYIVINVLIHMPALLKFF